MQTTNINCPCGNTTGYEHSHNLAECTSCATAVHVDTPTYHTYNVTPLSVIEQQAKDKAVIDMWINDQPFIDWSTCFNANKIEYAI
tara:strand:- start:400 stop:657 length:258 start_codon:yes stop_codon:yes gene_type:complete